MNLSSFEGNNDVKTALSDAKSSGRFPHAIVLQGDNGTGKRTFAKLIANALVCRDKENAPCGTCPSCIRAKAGSHPDIRIYEGSGATHSLSVDTAKEIIADAYRMPEEADVSIYLIFIESKMLEATQNKLLKIIEEPPKNTVFIMTCASSDVLLPTIRSRVQIFTLRPPTKEQAARYVAETHGIGIGEAEELAEICSGNIGRMLEEQEDGDGRKSLDIAVKIAELVSKSKQHELLAVTASMIRDRRLFLDVLDRLELILRDACVLRSGANNTLGVSPEVSEKLGRFTMKRLMRLAQIPAEYKAKLDRNANMTLLITSFCAELSLA